MCRRSGDYDDTRVGAVSAEISKCQSQPTQPQHVSEECRRVSEFQSVSDTCHGTILKRRCFGAIDRENNCNIIYKPKQV